MTNNVTMKKHKTMANKTLGMMSTKVTGIAKEIANVVAIMTKKTGVMTIAKIVAGKKENAAMTDTTVATTDHANAEENVVLDFLDASKKNGSRLTARYINFFTNSLYILIYDKIPISLRLQEKCTSKFFINIFKSSFSLPLARRMVLRLSKGVEFRILSAIYDVFGNSSHIKPRQALHTSSPT